MPNVWDGSRYLMKICKEGACDMRLLNPGDPCPCCGQPIKEGLPTETMVLLSWLAEGMALRRTMRGWDENAE